MCVVVLTRRRTSRLSFVFFLMIRRPPRSTLDRSSAASDVYKRQALDDEVVPGAVRVRPGLAEARDRAVDESRIDLAAVSYTHLRAHETVLDLACRLLLANKTSSLSLAQIHCKHKDK